MLRTREVRLEVGENRVRVRMPARLFAFEVLLEVPRVWVLEPADADAPEGEELVLVGPTGAEVPEDLRHLGTASGRTTGVLHAWTERP